MRSRIWIEIKVFFSFSTQVFLKVMFIFINDEKQNCINFLVFILWQYIRYTFHSELSLKIILSLQLHNNKSTLSVKQYFKKNKKKFLDYKSEELRKESLETHNNVNLVINSIKWKYEWDDKITLVWSVVDVCWLVTCIKLRTRSILPRVSQRERVLCHLPVVIIITNIALFISFLKAQILVFFMGIWILIGEL